MVLLFHFLCSQTNVKVTIGYIVAPLFIQQVLLSPTHPCSYTATLITAGMSTLNSLPMPLCLSFIVTLHHCSVKMIIGQVSISSSFQNPVDIAQIICHYFRANFPFGTRQPHQTGLITPFFCLWFFSVVHTIRQDQTKQLCHFAFLFCNGILKNDLVNVLS